MYVNHKSRQKPKRPIVDFLKDDGVCSGQYYCRTILDRVLGARAAGVHYRLFSVWTLVPVRRDQQLSDHSTVDEIASGAADCRLTYTMANCPQRRLEKPGEREKENEKKKERARKRQGLVVFRKRRGESQSFLLGDADEESETRMSKNALRTGRRQAVDPRVAFKCRRFEPVTYESGTQQLNHLEKSHHLCPEADILAYIGILYITPSPVGRLTNELFVVMASVSVVSSESDDFAFCINQGHQRWRFEPVAYGSEAE
ncbi:hypothetical protein TNCV_2552951 [Trichonephila clavipes]|nr:hypothetical protein TNCV_2552951 [Trichonephila clavipes]